MRTTLRQRILGALRPTQRPLSLPPRTSGWRLASSFAAAALIFAACGEGDGLTSPASVENVTRTYEGLRELLRKLDSRYAPGHLVEGIVFHHPDGRRAKIKRKDFGFDRPSKSKSRG